MNYAQQARCTLKWLLCEALNLLGVIPLLEAVRTDGVRILVYHRVSPSRIDDGMTISQMVFDAQLRYLSRKYSVISLDEVVEVLKGDKPLRRGLFALTLDDGYRNNYTRAWPILARYGMPATIFVAVRPLEGQGSLWTEEIREALWQSSCESLDLQAMGWGSWSLRTDPEKLACLWALKQRLKALPDAERQRAFLEVLKALDCQEQAKTEAEMLTWDMVREMRKEGVTIGAHTISHRILTQIDLTEAKWEVAESKRRIEQQLGEPIKHFAYPNGTRSDWNSKIQEIVKKAGFETACTTLRGANPVGSDAYALRRLEINDAGCTDPFGRFSPAMFAAQMVGLFGWRER